MFTILFAFLFTLGLPASVPSPRAPDQKTFAGSNASFGKFRAAL